MLNTVVNKVRETSARTGKPVVKKARSEQKVNVEDLQS